MRRSGIAALIIASFAHATDPPFPSEVPGCGVQATGDCWEKNETPGCTWTPCCELICLEFEPSCCENRWDDFCILLADAYCAPLPVCQTAEGDCFEEGEQGGCGAKSCCYLVCAIDSFCCSSLWDVVCAQMAIALCDAPLCPLPGRATRFEDEKCDARTNDGCNDPEGLFTPIACGDRWYGEIHAAIRRDTDWYRIDLDGPRTLIVTLHAEFSAEVFIASGTCEEGYQVETIGVAEPCGPVTIQALLDAGPVWIVVAPATLEGGIFTGMPCASDPPPWSPVLPRGYELELTCR